MERRRLCRTGTLIFVIGWQIVGITSQRLFWSGDFDPNGKWHNKTMLPAPFTCRKDYDITVPVELRPRSNIGIASWSIILDRNLFSQKVQIWGKLAKQERADTVSKVEPTFTILLLLCFVAITLIFIPIVLIVSKIVSIIVFFIWAILTHKVIRKFGRYLIIRSELLLRKREYENAVPDSRGVRRLRRRRFNLPLFFRSHPNEAVPDVLVQPKYSTFTLTLHDGFGHLTGDSMLKRAP